MTPTREQIQRAEENATRRTRATIELLAAARVVTLRAQHAPDCNVAKGGCRCGLRRLAHAIHATDEAFR